MNSHAEENGRLDGKNTMKPLVARIRQKRLAPVIQASKLVYQSATDSIQGYQLETFGGLWADIQRNVPHYQGLVQSGAAPAEIRDWDDFARLPILTRSSIQNDVARLIDRSQKIVGWSTTGGSTASPMRVPIGSLESQALAPLPWLGREWYGIEVADRLFHLWGHSHLFGKGWRRHEKQVRRRIKNRLLGYRRFSGYHLSTQRLREAGRSIIRMRPDYVIGYSRSLALLARANSDLADAFGELPIKAIIATAESFGQADDATTIEQVFGCPVAMEYGSVETGVIAYTHPSDRRYHPFWHAHLLEVVPIDERDAKLLVTALYPRVMPLIRYEIGDIIQDYDNKNEVELIEFANVRGRDNDALDLGDNLFIHPAAIFHCAYPIRTVLAVQIIHDKDKSISLNLMCRDSLSEADEAHLRRNLALVDHRLGSCKITRVDCLEQTIAGKTKTVIQR